MVKRDGVQPVLLAEKYKSDGFGGRFWGRVLLFLLQRIRPDPEIHEIPEQNGDFCSFF